MSIRTKYLHFNFHFSGELKIQDWNRIWKVHEKYLSTGRSPTFSTNSKTQINSKPQINLKTQITTSSSVPTWQKLGIQARMADKLEAAGLVRPSIIQCATIPKMRGKRDKNDLIVQEMTGQGKSLAFLLPILGQIDVKADQVQAIIVAPTRELATQLHILAVELIGEQKNAKNPLSVKLGVGEVNPAMIGQLFKVDTKEEDQTERPNTFQRAKKAFKHMVAAETKFSKMEQPQNRQERLEWRKKMSREEQAQKAEEREQKRIPHVLIGTAEVLQDLLIARKVLSHENLRFIVIDEVDAILNKEDSRDSLISLLLLRQQKYSSPSVENNQNQLTIASEKDKEQLLDTNQAIRDDRAQIVLVSATMPSIVRDIADRFLSKNAELVTAASLPDECRRRGRQLEVILPSHIRHFVLHTTDERRNRATVTVLSAIRHEFRMYRARTAAEMGTNKIAIARKHSYLKGGTSAVGIDKLFAQTTAVFCNDKNILSNMAKLCSENGFTVATLCDHSSRTERRDALKPGAADVLLTVDLYARGLDVKTLTHVINRDLPRTASAYLHRAGRVGRLGALYSKFGVVINVVNDQEANTLKKYAEQFGLPPLTELVVRNGKLYMAGDSSHQLLKLVPTAPCRGDDNAEKKIAEAASGPHSSHKNSKPDTVMNSKAFA